MLRRVPVWVWWAIPLAPLAILMLPRLALMLIGGGYYSIPSSSMLPTLPVGSAFLAMPVRTGTLPQRGDVVVFSHPRNPEVDYVKRIVGLPGDRIAVRNGVVWLNGVELRQRTRPEYTAELDINGFGGQDSCELSEDRRSKTCTFAQREEVLPSGRRYAVLDMGHSRADEFTEVTVPDSHVFGLGDHRDNAVDSRFPSVGMIPVKNLKHRAWRFWVNFAKPGAHWGRFGQEVR